MPIGEAGDVLVGSPSYLMRKLELDRVMWGVQNSLLTVLSLIPLTRCLDSRESTLALNVLERICDLTFGTGMLLSAF